MLRFYRRWIHTAFFHSLGPIDLWTGLVVSALGVVDHYVPEVGLMTAYEWQIPLWALAAVMAVRLLMAPYWMWHEEAQKNRALIATLKSQKEHEEAQKNRVLIATLKSQEEHEEASRAKAEAAATKASGYLALIKSGEQLARQTVASNKDYKNWAEAYSKWMEEAKEFIERHDGYRAAGNFIREPQWMVVRQIEHVFNSDHSSELDRLGEKISDLTASYENAMDEKRRWDEEST